MTWSLHLELAKEPARTILLTSVTAGMRPGELFALRISDVSLGDEPEIRLRRFIGKNSAGKPIENAKGKSKRARRTIPLIRVTAVAMEQHIIRHGLKDNDLLFSDANGGFIRDYNWRKRTFKPLVKSLGGARCAAI